MRKINTEECVKFVKNKLKVKLTYRQEEMLRAFCEGKEVRSARGVGRSTVATAFGMYIANLYDKNDYSVVPEVIIDYHALLDNGIVSNEYIKLMRFTNPETFKKEYECR